MLAFELEMHSFVCSQMLILPPFQGEGHGAQLLETVHRYYMSSPTVLDITGLCYIFNKELCRLLAHKLTSMFICVNLKPFEDLVSAQFRINSTLVYRSVHGVAS